MAQTSTNIITFTTENMVVNPFKNLTFGQISSAQQKILEEDSFKLWMGQYNNENIEGWKQGFWNDCVNVMSPDQLDLLDHAFRLGTNKCVLQKSDNKFENNWHLFIIKALHVGTRYNYHTIFSGSNF